MLFSLRPEPYLPVRACLCQALTSWTRLNLRVFSDQADSRKMWKASVKDIAGEILSVSQFTLMANTTKGSKPDFHGAMVSYTYLSVPLECRFGLTCELKTASQSQELYNSFLAELGKLHDPSKVKGERDTEPLPVCPLMFVDLIDGKFGAMMNVSLTNEGSSTNFFGGWHISTELSTGPGDIYPRLSQVSLCRSTFVWVSNACVHCVYARRRLVGKTHSEVCRQCIQVLLTHAKYTKSTMLFGNMLYLVSQSM